MTVDVVGIGLVLLGAGVALLTIGIAFFRTATEL